MNLVFTKECQHVGMLGKMSNNSWKKVFQMSNVTHKNKKKDNTQNKDKINYHNLVSNTLVTEEEITLRIFSNPLLKIDQKIVIMYMRKVNINVSLHINIVLFNISGTFTLVSNYYSYLHEWFSYLVRMLMKYVQVSFDLTNSEQEITQFFSLKYITP